MKVLLHFLPTSFFFISAEITGGIWVTCLISSKITLCDWMLWALFVSETKSYPVTLLVFSLEHEVFTVNLLILVPFAHCIGWKYPKTPRYPNTKGLVSFCFISAFNLSLPPLILLSSKKKSRQHFHTLLQVHWLQLLFSK